MCKNGTKFDELDLHFRFVIDSCCLMEFVIINLNYLCSLMLDEVIINYCDLINVELLIE